MRTGLKRIVEIPFLLVPATEEFDVLVIGGGATGAGCAVDASSRGLKTALVELDDFASGTSSRSTKLIHLFTEAEGACWCDLRNEAFRCQCEGTLLTTDGRLGEIDHSHQHELLCRCGGDHAAAAMQGDRLLQLWPRLRPWL